MGRKSTEKNMAETFLFSKPFTFLACPGMSEVRPGIDALDALPGHIFWLESEDLIRRDHVPDFLEQSRVALEAVLPGGVALVDAMVDDIRRSTGLLPELQCLDPDAVVPMPRPRTLESREISTTCSAVAARCRYRWPTGSSSRVSSQYSVSGYAR